jgi:hypothetical protein
MTPKKPHQKFKKHTGSLSEFFFPQDQFHIINYLQITKSEKLLENVSFFEPQITIKQNTTVLKGGMSPKSMGQIIMLH